MNHKEKIEALNKKNQFDTSNKSQSTTETFITQEKSRNIMKQTYEKKKEADAVFKLDRKRGYDLYLESIFGYINGYLMFEKEYGINKIIKEWKTLDQFITGLNSSFKVEEHDYKNMYEYILFNIRFHYLFYEGFHAIQKGNDECKKCLEGYMSLKSICEKSQVDNFCVLRLEKIKDYVREKLKITNVNKQ